jgi:hypothetical protein
MYSAKLSYVTKRFLEKKPRLRKPLKIALVACLHGDEILGAKALEKLTVPHVTKIISQ